MISVKDLIKIEHWDGDLSSCLDFVASLWEKPGTVERLTEWDATPGNWYKFSTGQSSDNIDIMISLFNGSYVYGLTWYSSYRGGIHFFLVPENQKQKGHK